MTFVTASTEVLGGKIWTWFLPRWLGMLIGAWSAAPILLLYSHIAVAAMIGVVIDWIESRLSPFGQLSGIFSKGLTIGIVWSMWFGDGTHALCARHRAAAHGRHFDLPCLAGSGGGRRDARRASCRAGGQGLEVGGEPQPQALHRTQSIRRNDNQRGERCCKAYLMTGYDNSHRISLAETIYRVRWMVLHRHRFKDTVNRLTDLRTRKTPTVLTSPLLIKIAVP